MDLKTCIEMTDTHPEGGAPSDRTTYRFTGIPPGTLTRFFKAIEE